MSTPHPCCRRPRDPFVERLETRMLLAADVPLAAVRAGMLRITGTTGDDVIRLALSATNPGELQVFSGNSTAPLAKLALTDFPRGCRVDADAGDDQVLVDET